ncbi:peroxidase family protein [Caulobacter sp. 17J65-9]|uniref:peroxidase family protein n=1 Tax=Caulobacter sp. 17J65-9 TaxID=2709382 RepID=UPI0013CB138A|nr:peroxidase family protein [Caulobacter sp. 17J65-9]NEX94780.1 heme peroxidase [Caulobacter sp. 17J65-9]
MAKFIRSDLEFILQQIKIAEAHANGTPLTDLIPSPVLSFGLRTVDGSYNNLVPGQQNFGAADQLFPRMTSPYFRNAENGTSYDQVSGMVVDSQPRVISNLISDISSHNPAAAAAAGFDLALGLDGVAGTEDDGKHVDSLFIPNVAPDVGLSAPFNSWMTLFGQFFDHGLDLVSKGGSGFVYIPLKPDDPLYDADGPDNVANSGDETNFMILNRATNLPGPDNVLGTSDDIHDHNNQTTPFVDQNQTYTSHPSHQVFLREYAMVDGRPVSTGNFLNGAQGGLATWDDIKEQARTKLGILLTDADVTDLPLLATDPYGAFLRGPNGLPLVVMKGADGKAGTADDQLVQGNLASPISTANAARTGHAFLDDIAHAANPRDSQTGAMLTPDSDTDVGVDDHNPLTYDDELLGRHFATGDGRGNENIGLTAVHTIFHAEHNRLVEHTKEIILATNDPVFIQEWVKPGANIADGVQDSEWNGERLFQTARFGTEMQYQHLVFEEFARKIQPNVDIFIAPVGYDTGINPAIVAEFAHTVYRFGHSMLTESIDRLDPNFQSSDLGLIEAFLNPVAFDKDQTIDADAAAGEIVRGMTRQVGSHMDEFVTGAVRNNLLGLPLDLPAINITRARDAGIPSLNMARREFYAATTDSQLKPYTSWTDFAGHLKNELSIVNFVAAYGLHPLVTNETTLEGKRAAAWAIITGQSVTIAGDPNTTDDDRVIAGPADRLAFLNSTGAWASGAGGVTTTGLDNVDFWIGGLAEEVMPFGGMLGSTFGFVFESQLENLQNGDRFYYLARTAGMNFINELEQNSFASLIMLNTDARHLPLDVFSTPAFILEVDQSRQFHAGLGSADPTGGSLTQPLVIRGPGNHLEYTGPDHVVLGGTDDDDTLISSEGDDTIWGDGGRDRIDGGFGNDNIDGGAGDDIIWDRGGDDVIKGGEGNDAINGGAGLNLIIAGGGSDFIVTGIDVAEVFAGEGDDFINGSTANEGMQGNEGDDWIEVGTQDGAPGDNFDPFGLDPIIGNDVFFGDGGFDEYVGEGGDDIMVGSGGINRNEGMSGFDWVTYKDHGVQGVLADLLLPAFDETPAPPSPNTALDRYAEVEGLSGSRYDDVLFGDDEDAATIPVNGARGSTLTNIGLISGLADVLAPGATSFSAGNILLGGDGSDILEGRAGDDIIDGDRWLNVRISVRDPGDPAHELFTVDRMTALQEQVFAGEINPGQLKIVREILTADGSDDIDTAVFTGNRADYTITAGPRTGSFIVTDNVGTNGSDTVRNIERLKFADQTVAITGGNAAASGTVNISDATPAENQTLTATGAFTDLNGVDTSTIRFIWQVETTPDTWADIGEGTNFQPGDAQVDRRLRVMAVFNDLTGALESVTSAPTAAVTNVNDAATGNPDVNDVRPTEGSMLTATPGNIDDADGMAGAVFGYQWQQLIGNTWTNIANANGANFTPTQTQVNRQLRVVVSFTDAHGTAEQRISQPTAVTGDLFVGTNLANIFNGGGGDDNASGQGGDDTLSGGGGDDILNGGAGGDTLRGDAGADTLDGGAGADNLDGGAGADTMIGGTGNDTFTVDNIGDVVMEAAGTQANGSDTVRTSLNSRVLAANVENLTFTGNGGFAGTGNELNNRIQGGNGADTLDGAGGADTLVGGAGNDTYFVDSVNDDITEANNNGGVDVVMSTSASFNLDNNVENFQQVGASGVVVTGNGLNNSLIGGVGADNISGAGGVDVIEGAGGNDVMDGGGGNDRFVFRAGFGTDRINNFDANPNGGGQDALDLRPLGITGASFGASVTIQAVSGGTMVIIDDDEIFLAGVGVNTVTQQDFILAA